MNWSGLDSGAFMMHAYPLSQLPQTPAGRLRYAGAILIRTADGEFCTAGIATPPAKVQSVPCQVCKGARFTCRACGGTGTIHRDIKPPRPTPAPFVPLVDEWDLLPDA